jgi:large subunit ribosomal protein L33
VTKKNRKNTPERLELKKFNPILKRITVHREIK